MNQNKTSDKYYVIFKYFWIIVLFPKPVQLILFGILLLYLTDFKPHIPNDYFGRIQAGVLAFYLVSIILNIFMHEHELERIFAAINTLGISLIALGLYDAYQKVNLDLNRIGKYSFINLLIMLLFVIIYLFFPYMEQIHIGGYYLFAGDILFDEYCTRFVGMFAYANLITIFVVCALPFVLFLFKGNKVWFSLCLGVCYLFEDSANSRTGKLLLIAIFLTWAYFNLWLKIPTQYKTRFIIGTILLSVIILMLGFPYLSVIFDKVMNSRAGSNSTRTVIYQESLHAMLQKNPVLGLGVKDMMEGMPYPYGSHSSYLGYYYKTGIIGGTLYTFSFLLEGVKAFKWKKQSQFDYILFICFFAVLFWMVLEDLDGVNWSVCIFFIYMAILNRRMKTEEGTENEPTAVHNR